MKQEIEHASGPVRRRQQFLIERQHFRPDAAQAFKRRKQRVEQRRAHQDRGGYGRSRMLLAYLPRQVRKSLAFS